MAFLSALSLAIPGTPLDSMWRINPRARVGFGDLGALAAPLMLAVSTSCGAAALGLWRGARWGHRLAITLLSVNLVGDALNAVLGSEPRALIGIPIAGLLIAYLLSRRTRYYFVQRRFK